MVHELLLYYQDMKSSGILLFAAFILLRLLTHNKPAIDTTSRSRRGTVTPAVTGAVIETFALLVTEGVLVDELKVDALVGTAEQSTLNNIYI